ncbi:MAG: serine hydrolase [Cylindrospermopsis raciborskii 1523720]|uniref:serine hydrolase n=1 Tax=Cylindrospermopsis raciborskii TaxID=77022 RepID=UPI002B4A4A1A|nr:serine hydrolase [Cylindrospermopsis raciborskii]MEB3146924.1 serine hydrolase [Cylindrospermopsis raciborskii]
MITGSGDQSPKIRRRHHKQRSQDHTQKTTAKTAQRTQSKPAKMQSTGLNYQQNVKVLPTIASDNHERNETDRIRQSQRLVVSGNVKPTAKPSGKMTGGNPRVKTLRVPGHPKKYAYPSRKARLKPAANIILYALRLLIVGVGLGAIVGTLLSVLDPANRITTNSINPPVSSSPQSPINSSGLVISQEITPLKITIENLSAANPNLIPGVFIVDIDSGGYVDVSGNKNFSAASTIKIPVLVAFLEDVDRGKIRLDEILTMEQEMVAGGSGNLRTMPVGTKLKSIELATKMMTISDNTATNMLISKLGGKELLNARFRSWGLVNTAIQSPLPDLEGTNTTSPKELASLIAKVNQGELISMRSRDLMLDIMRRTQRDDLLPAGLGEGATAYHKTGDIGTMLADAGLIDVPTGKRYIASIMVKRPHNEPAAAKLINSISQATYSYLSQSNFPPDGSTNNQPLNNSSTPVPQLQPFTQPFLQPQGGNSNIPNATMNNVPLGNYQSPLNNPPPPQSHRN